MSRPRIPSSLLGSASAARENAARLESLTTVMLAAAQEIVPDAIRRESASLSADDLIGAARETLESLLSNPTQEELQPAEVEMVRRATRDALLLTIPEPEPEEIRAMTLKTARVITANWCELLARGTRSGEIDLDSHLLPKTRWLSDADLRMWRLARASLPVSGDDVAKIMEGFSARVFPHGTSSISLPERVSVRVDHGGSFHARRE